ncbi:vinculin family domain-containing protein [Ditylenchus destructor]|nr:vinculin family domain-containing protein [Ditylenchus destructor]
MNSNGNHYTLDADIDKIKTKTVERLISPLVYLVTNLRAEFYPPSQSNHDGNTVLLHVKQTLENFLAIGEGIIRNYPLAVGKALDELNGALSNVQISGNDLLNVGSEFVKSPGNANLRARTVKAGQNTLVAVARLMIMADMIEVRLILEQAEKVRNILEGTGKADSTKELLETCTNLDTELEILTEMTRKRLKDLKNPSEQDDLQAAIAMLKITTPIMIASSKAFVRHPELDAAKINREYAYGEMQKALDCFQDVIKGQVPSEEVAISRFGKINELVANLEEFQQRVHMDPSAYRPHKHRPQLEELLERIAYGSAQIADIGNTRPERRGQIIAGVNNLRQALQDLLKEYEQNIGRTEPNEDLDLSVVHLMGRVKDLRRFLRRAIVDHVSDAFVDTRTPLIMLIDFASRGDKPNTEQAAQMFQAHAENIVDVARLVCDMSNDSDGVRVLRYAALLCEKIAPQVVNAAFLLCEKPNSPVVQENMKVFENVWLDRLKVLTMAMDNLISVEDFLSVTEAHISEDVKNALKAIVERDAETLDRTAGAIRGRSIRVCDVVANEIEQLPPSHYSENVKDAIKRLREDALPQFVNRVEKIGSNIDEAKQSGIERDHKEDVDEMIEACNLVYEAVGDVRCAFLMNMNPEDMDSDNEYEEDGMTTVNDSRSQVSDNDGENQQRIMRHLPEESKREIQKQIDVFKITQRKFEYEVGKWDEAGNDIIALAKHMCQIMANMTDFTKGRGPLRTTMDVIKAAQEISDDGNKLNALAKQIGNESVESQTRSDLFAYSERITLFCHQLNVTSKVKADVQVVGDELRVSGLEAATSLIQNAKNLLNAVILTVKAAFIASTKYRRKESTKPRLVEWRMAPPQKQPLVKSPPKNQGIIRRVSERRPQQPMQTLSQFQAR